MQEGLQGLSSEFDTRLEQQSRSHREESGEITGRILDVRAEVETVSGQVNRLAKDVLIVKGDLEKCTEHIRKRQGESIAQLHEALRAGKSGNERKFEMLNSAIDKLKGRAEGNPGPSGKEVTRVREVVDVAQSSPTPPPFVNVASVSSIGDASCSCKLNSCIVCVNGGVICEDVSVPVRHHSANSCLRYTDLPLPQFDDSSEVKPIFHLNQLDEFINNVGLGPPNGSPSSMIRCSSGPSLLQTRRRGSPGNSSALLRDPFSVAKSCPLVRTRSLTAEGN